MLRDRWSWEHRVSGWRADRARQGEVRMGGAGGGAPRWARGRGGRWAGAAVLGGAWPADPSCGVAQARLSGPGPGIRGSGRTWWDGRRANAV